MQSYAQRLEAQKEWYPFHYWRESELDQYTEDVCDAFEAVFDQLIEGLARIGTAASEEQKLALFEEAIRRTNELNEEDLSVIESGERDALCELCNRIAVAAGLDPSKYGGGEGPASEWRDW